MNELLHQLGIDWKLLVSQGVNFAVLLVVLTVFVYRPLMRVMEERRRKIELGLKGAEEVERRLGEIEKMKSEKIVAAEKSAMEIIKSAEQEGRVRAQGIISETNKKAETLLQDAAETAEHRRIDALERLAQEAKLLVKEAIVKTVSLRPEQVDEELVKQAIQAVKQGKP